MSNQPTPVIKTHVEALRVFLRQSPETVYCPKFGGWLSAAEMEERWREHQLQGK